MKMQEVIMRLRELAPAAERDVRAACEDFASLRDMLKDAGHTNSPVSMRVLQAACSDKADRISESLDRAAASIEALATVNREYKEKLGPRAKKPKDCPGQMDLFDGRPAADDTSVTSRKCPRCKTSALGCEFFDKGVCKGVVYPTNPPQYDPCVFCSVEVRQ